MATFRELTGTRCLMGRLAHGADLLEELTAVCIENGVALGWIEALGAVRKARLGYYDQEAREYRFFEVDQPLEITALAGNVSTKDGEPVVHAHVTLADDAGRAVGGHLAPGTVVFACEFCLRVLAGAEFARGFDAETGLPLWQL